MASRDGYLPPLPFCHSMIGTCRSEEMLGRLKSFDDLGNEIPEEQTDDMADEMSEDTSDQ